MRLVKREKKRLFQPLGIFFKPSADFSKFILEYIVVFISRDPDDKRRYARVGHIFLGTGIENIVREPVRAHIVVEKHIVPRLIGCLAVYAEMRDKIRTDIG